MNQLCPFCWTEMKRAVRTVTVGTRVRELPLIECPHCAAAGTSNLLHSHHAYQNAITRVERYLERAESQANTLAERQIIGDVREAIGKGLV